MLCSLSNYICIYLFIIYLLFTFSNYYSAIKVNSEILVSVFRRLCICGRGAAREPSFVLSFDNAAHHRDASYYSSRFPSE